MKTFRCLVGVRHPAPRVAAAVRDLMSEIAPSLEHVERICALTRAERADGGVALVNEWRVNPALPPALESLVAREKLGWLDHAEWAADLTSCNWRIEPHFMAEAIDCRGVTRFEPAMGGRGARVTFEGELDIDPAALSSIPVAWRAPASVAVEMLISTLIPRNFRRTIEMIDARLSEKVQPTSTA